MDAFSWVIIVALGACVLMHLFGHGHGHGTKGRSQEEEHPGHAPSHRGEDKTDRVMSGTSSGHRHGRGGCH